MRKNHQILFLIACVGFSKGLSARIWPEIAPLVKNFQLQDKTKESFNLVIKDLQGNPLYMLDGRINCWDQDYVGFNFSGAFECRLKALYERARNPTLLTDHPRMVTDWQSRGRFLIEELIQDRDHLIPAEYGRLRHFRLRGMILTLNVKNIVFIYEGGRTGNSQDTDRIKTLDLEVTVSRDLTATSDIAEKTAIPCPTPCSH